MSKSVSLPIPFGWYPIAYTKELAIGEVKPMHFFARDLVAFRTESGEAKVLDAFCPHLGAHLGHGGKVVGESIACPFHGWQFNGGGECTGVPYAKNMPPKVAGGKQALYAYPTVERNQVIWTWYHPHRIEPTFDVLEVEEFSSPDWTEMDCYEWEIDVPIQEAGENAVDAAHFIYVHNALEMPVGTTEIKDHTRVSNYEMKVPLMTDDGVFDMTKTRASYLQTKGNGPGQSVQRFTGAVETVQQGLVVPITANKMRLRFAFIQPKALSEGKKVLAFGVRNEISNQVVNDIPIWNHKVYKENPILCDGDGPIHQYRKWFSQFYAELQPEPIRAVS
jgi:3-ketosteroid 9alpha-monooxygenase subunit A